MSDDSCANSRTCMLNTMFEHSWVSRTVRFAVQKKNLCELPGFKYLKFLKGLRHQRENLFGSHTKT